MYKTNGATNPQWSKSIQLTVPTLNPNSNCRPTVGNQVRKIILILTDTHHSGFRVRVTSMIPKTTQHPNSSLELAQNRLKKRYN